MIKRYSHWWRIAIIVISEAVLIAAAFLGPGARFVNEASTLALILFAVAVFSSGMSRSWLMFAVVPTVLLGAAIVLPIVPYAGSQISAALVESAIVVVAVAVFSTILRAAPRYASAIPVRSFGRATATARVAITTVGEVQGAETRTMQRVVLASVLLSLVLGAYAALPARESWRLAGGHLGEPLWSAHIMSTAMDRVNGQLVDPSVLDSKGNAIPVVDASSAVATALKMAHPGHLPGPSFQVAFSVLGTLALAFAAIWFLRALGFRNGGELAGFALPWFPVLGLIRTDLAFDLAGSLAAYAAATRLPRTVSGIAVATVLGFVVPFIDSGGGYQLAAIATASALVGRLRPVCYGLLAGTAIGTAAMFAWLRHASPGMLDFALWWRITDITRLFEMHRAEFGVTLALVFCAATGIVLYGLAKRAPGGVMKFLGVLFILSVVLAIPPAARSVELLVPSRFLDAGPFGWPTLRVVEVGLILPLVAFALGLEALIRTVPFMRTRASKLAAFVGVCFVLAEAKSNLPHTTSLIATDIPNRARAAIFPGAASDSLAAARDARDLFESGATVAQPNPYVSGVALSEDARLDGRETLEALRKARIPFVFVEPEGYALLADRFTNVRPYPALDAYTPHVDQPFTLEGTTTGGSLYELKL